MKEIEKFFEQFDDLDVEASSSKITEIENKYDIKISEEIKYLWSNCKEIQFGYSGSYFSPLKDISYFYETIDDLLFNFEELNELQPSPNNSPGIKPVAYTNKWIPFINVDGLFYFFDFDPAIQGKYGQIIRSDMMGGENEATVLFSNLEEFFLVLNREISKGKLEVSVDSGAVKLIPIDEEYDLFLELGLWE